MSYQNVDGESKKGGSWKPWEKSGANGMRYGDRITHDLDGFTGVAGEFTQDGDVSITADDGTHRNVKWNNCSPERKGRAL